MNCPSLLKYNPYDRAFLWLCPIYQVRSHRWQLKKLCGWWTRQTRSSFFLRFALKGKAFTCLCTLRRTRTMCKHAVAIMKSYLVIQSTGRPWTKDCPMTTLMIQEHSKCLRLSLINKFYKWYRHNNSNLCLYPLSNNLLPQFKNQSKLKHSYLPI